MAKQHTFAKQSDAKMFPRFSWPFSPHSGRFFLSLALQSRERSRASFVEAPPKVRAFLPSDATLKMGAQFFKNAFVALLWLLGIALWCAAVAAFFKDVFANCIR